MSDTPDLTGTQVMGYRLERPIGEGGMASVWLATHPTLAKRAAVKVLDPLLTRQATLVERFLAEARIQVHLVHPNIVRVENVSTEPLAMVMEYVEGRPLSESIGRSAGPVPLTGALPILRQVLSAIEYAHAQGVVHRDVKPANVILTPDGVAKVMDFGIAKILTGGGSTRTGTSMGTPAYMAPEQIQGAKDVDARADIYALGVMLYEVVTGRRPFDSGEDEGSDFRLMSAQVNDAAPDPRTFCPDVPEAVAAVILKALEKDPSKRHPTVAALAEALEATVDGAEGLAVPVAVPAPAPPTPAAPTRYEAPESPARADEPAPSRGLQPWHYAVLAVLFAAVGTALWWPAGSGRPTPNDDIEDSSAENPTEEAADGREADELDESDERAVDPPEPPTRHVVTAPTPAVPPAVAPEPASPAVRPAVDPTPVAKPPGHPPVAPAATPLPLGTIAGTAVEVLRAGKYLIVKIESGRTARWAAALGGESVKIGDPIRITVAMMQRDFVSKSLNRTFETIWFGKLAPPTKPPDSARRQVTVAMLYQARRQVAGKTVTVSGRVTKFNSGVLNRNWIHLRDGSGSAAEWNNDLTITTAPDALRPAVGETITATGQVTLDRDFGGGVRYTLLLEKAVIEKGGPHATKAKP